MAKTGNLTTKREVVKRRRRDRQLVVFGFLLVALGFFAFVAYSVYQGRIDSPLHYGFVTPSAEITKDIRLACPPTGDGAMPMPADEISFRTLNATGETGLARTFMTDLQGRGFVGVQATNWNRKYDGVVRITFGKEGLRQAYTLSNQFEEFELVYDNRDSAIVDLILGDGAVNAELRPAWAPELSLDLELTAPGPCLPIGVLRPEPGPARLPADPLVSPTPTDEDDAEGDEVVAE